MKQVNLEEIMVKHLSQHTVDISKTAFRANGTPLSLFDLYKNMMQEACNQTVDLCAENAEVRVTENALIEEGSCYTTYDDGVISVTSDKQSILDTKKQIV